MNDARDKGRADMFNWKVEIGVTGSSTHRPMERLTMLMAPAFYHPASLWHGLDGGMGFSH